MNIVSIIIGIMGIVIAICIIKFAISSAFKIGIIAAIAFCVYYVATEGAIPLAHAAIDKIGNIVKGDK